MGKKCHVAGLTNPSGVDLRSKSGEIILTIHPPKMSVPDQGTTRKGGSLGPIARSNPFNHRQVYTGVNSYDKGLK